MGAEPSVTSPSIPGILKIVSPYGADIDTSIAGTVQYTPFNGEDSDMSTQMRGVSDFIQNLTGSLFHGSKMMVAEWDRVVLYNGNHVSFNPLSTIIQGLVPHLYVDIMCSNCMSIMFSGHKHTSLACRYVAHWWLVIHKMSIESHLKVTKEILLYIYVLVVIVFCVGRPKELTVLYLT